MVHYMKWGAAIGIIPDGAGGTWIVGTPLLNVYDTGNPPICVGPRVV